MMCKKTQIRNDLFNAPLYIYGSPIDKGAFSLRLRSKKKETRMALCSLLKLLIDTR